MQDFAKNGGAGSDMAKQTLEDFDKLQLNSPDQLMFVNGQIKALLVWVPLTIGYLICGSLLLWGPQYMLAHNKLIVVDHTLGGLVLLGWGMSTFIWNPTDHGANLLGGHHAAILLLVSIGGIGSGFHWKKLDHAFFAFLPGLFALCSLMETRRFVIAGASSAMLCGNASILVMMLLGHLGNNDAVKERGHLFFMFFVSLLAVGAGRLTLEPFALWSRLTISFAVSMAGLVLLDIDAWRSPVWTWKDRLIATENRLSTDKHNVMCMQLLVCMEAAILLSIYIVRLSFHYSHQQSLEWVAIGATSEVDDATELHHIIGMPQHSDEKHSDDCNVT
jgi:hypothetical protein